MSKEIAIQLEDFNVGPFLIVKHPFAFFSSILILFLAIYQYITSILFRSVVGQSSSCISAVYLMKNFCNCY